ncbi:MAG: response regulator [Reyranella sp.]|nr:response regulator [Reyranella sp.]
MPRTSGTVLIVDDDAAVRSALKFVLEVEGLDVRLYDGPVALLAETELPAHACLIVDYLMPGMDGLNLVDRLRERQVGLPVILITARISDDLSRRAERAGVKRILEKPLSDSKLIDSIYSALGPSR